MHYLQQKASPWVSVFVLAGGFAIAMILLSVVNVEAKIGNAVSPLDLDEIYLSNE